MTTIQIRVDDTLKKEADALFASLGLDTTTAVNWSICYRRRSSRCHVGGLNLYSIVFTRQMKKDVKTMKKRGKDMEKLIQVLHLLANGSKLSAQYRDHQLTGNLRDFRECHIEPDWLLIYQIQGDRLILSAVETGSHADLLKR